MPAPRVARLGCLLLLGALWALVVPGLAEAFTEARIQFSQPSCQAPATPAWCTQPGVYALPASGGTPSLLQPGLIASSEWSADGSTMLFETLNPATGGTAAFGVKHGSGGSQTILQDPNSSSPSISPDGSQVVYDENQNGLDIVGTASPHGASHLLSFGQEPYWVNAHTILFFGNPPMGNTDNDGLYAIDPTNAAAKPTLVNVVDNGPDAGSDQIGVTPTASPDGSTYYFVGQIERTHGLYSVPAQGGSPTLVVQDSPGQSPFTSISWPRVASTGKVLYNLDTANTGTQAYVFPGGAVVANDPDASDSPTWAPPPPQGTIHGQVTGPPVLPDGPPTPLSGIKVNLSGNTSTGTAVALTMNTDANGDYSFSVSPGTYSVTVPPSDQETFVTGICNGVANANSCSQIGIVGSETKTANFATVQPEISGKITTPFGDGWGGATVQVRGTDSTTGQTVNLTKTTASNGSYSFGLNPGNYTVTPQPAVPGYPLAAAAEFLPGQCDGAAGPHDCTVALSSGHAATANFTAAYPISGKVSGVDGSGISGATVRFEDFEQGTVNDTTAVTDSAGHFSELLAPGKVEVFVDPLGSDSFFPVPDTKADPDCAVNSPPDRRCLVNLDQYRTIAFESCVVPNPNGDPLPEPLASNAAIQIPGAITSQNLEAVGCWAQQSTGSDYVSTQPVRLDGLDLVPASSSTRFELDQTHAIVHVNGPANLQLKGFVIWPGMDGANLNFEGSSIAASDLGLGESYGGFAGPRAADVPLHLLTAGTGGSYATLLPPWSSTQGQTSLTLNPVVPGAAVGDRWNYPKQEFQDASGAKVPNVGPQATITTTNRQGLLKPLVCLTIGDVDLTPFLREEPFGNGLVINGLNGCYDFAKGEVSISGILELPPAVKFADRFSAALTYKNYHVEKAAFQLGGLNKPMGNPYFYWQQGGISASWDTDFSPPKLLTVGVNGGFSFGPQLTRSAPFGPLVKLFPSLEGYELATLDAEGVLTLSTPMEMTLNGNIILFRKSPIQASIAGGFINYWTTGKFDWGGALKLQLPVVHAGLSASVNGFLDTDARSGAFQLQGYGRLTGLWGSPDENQILINNNVIAACSTHEDSWFVYHWGGSIDPFPPGVCNLGNYTIPEPDPTKQPPPPPGLAADAPGSASTARSHPGRGPFGFRLRRGLSNVALAIRGTTAAPVIELRGPHGTTITTPKSGTLDRARSTLFQDASTRTTYVGLANPPAGTWIVKALPGSAAIASVLESNPVAPAPISARIREAGCRHQITYTYHPANGDQVSLYVQNGSERTFFGYARAGTHRLSFVPALSGRGQLIAFETHHGLPRFQRTILTFSPAAYRRIATPRRIRVNHGILTWLPACGARSYTVAIVHDGTDLSNSVRSTRLRLPRFKGRFTVTIGAIGADRGQRTSARARLTA